MSASTTTAPPTAADIVSRVYPAGTIANIRNSKIIKYTDGIKNSTEIIHYLHTIPIVQTVTPEVNINVFFKNVGNKVNGTLSGVDVAGEDQLFQMSQMMGEGKMERPRLPPRRHHRRRRTRQKPQPESR